jgi:hypothetical protein
MEIEEFDAICGSVVFGDLLGESVADLSAELAGEPGLLGLQFRAQMDDRHNSAADRRYDLEQLGAVTNDPVYPLGERPGEGERLKEAAMAGHLSLGEGNGDRIAIREMDID